MSPGGLHQMDLHCRLSRVNLLGPDSRTTWFAALFALDCLAMSFHRAS